MAYIMPPIPPIPPPPGGIAGIADSASGESVISTSVVSIRPEIDAAFCSAERVTPKMHILEYHVIDFVKKWKMGCGFYNEQVEKSYTRNLTKW